MFYYKMSLQNLTLKELKAMTKKKQSQLCPPYSKMKKSELINYLQGESTKSTLTGPQSTFSNVESPYFNPRKKTLRKKKQVTPKKLSSGPYHLDKVFKQDQRKYKQLKVHKKRTPSSIDRQLQERLSQRLKDQSPIASNFKSMKVVELKQKLKSMGLNTKGKKADLIKRLENEYKMKGSVNTSDWMEKRKVEKKIKSLKQKRDKTTNMKDYTKFNNQIKQLR